MSRKMIVQAMIDSMKNAAVARDDESQFLEWCAIERHEIARGYRDDSYTSKEDREALMVSDPLADERHEAALWGVPKENAKDLK